MPPACLIVAYITIEVVAQIDFHSGGEDLLVMFKDFVGCTGQVGEDHLLDDVQTIAHVIDPGHIVERRPATMVVVGCGTLQALGKLGAKAPTLRGVLEKKGTRTYQYSLNAKQMV